MAHVARPAPSGGFSTTISSSDPRESTWLERIVATVERNSLWALAALMSLAGALLLYMGRGLTFFYDDWDFVTHDYGGGIHSLLAAHVGNISVFPVAVYKVLFHLVGLNHYAVFRLVVIGLHLLCGALVFVLAARRISPAPALLAAALILFLGAAWEDLLWAFQIGYMLSVAGGLAAWVLLERNCRWSEIAAMLCVLVAAGSSSLGVAVMVGVAVELSCARRWRSAWIVLIPAFLYLLWYLGYGESQLTENGLINAPGFAEDLAAAAFGGLVGRALEWGRPLALLGTFLILRRLVRPLPVSSRLAGLLATAVTLWAITAVARSTISQPEASRYIYLGAVVIVLVGIELLHEVTITPRATGLATLLVAFCAITGTTVLHAGAMGLRSDSKAVTAELGALELDAAYAPPTYQPDPQRAPQIMAGPYLHTVRAIGSTPADSTAGIETAGAIPRENADRVMRELLNPEPVSLLAGERTATTAAPTLEAASGASVSRRGPCLRVLPRQAGATITIVLPVGGVLIRNGAPQPVGLSVRRFGDAFALLSEGVPAHSVRALILRADSSPIPWHLQVGLPGPVSVCDAAS
jgi:hypothetical protein